MVLAAKISSRVSGCEVLKARDPVEVLSRRIEACGWLEAVERIIGRELAPFDRARVVIGNFDREFAGDREAGCFDGGEWARPLGLHAGALRCADPPARFTTLHGEAGQSVGEFFRGLCRRGGGCDCGRREVERRLFGTHQELLHSTGVRGSRAGERGGVRVIVALSELVVLVDEQNNVLGTMPKSEVHRAQTPLHRAFSLFLFNRKGELLLQQRSHLKKTWPLVWSNSCCGHPGLDEPTVDAARRRLADELGTRAAFIEEVSPYRYKFVRYGVMENEICPILVGFTDELPTPNPEEVEAVRWTPWQVFLADITAHPGQYSEWCEEEAHILAKHPRFAELYSLETR